MGTSRTQTDTCWRWEALWYETDVLTIQPQRPPFWFEEDFAHHLNKLEFPFPSSISLSFEKLAQFHGTLFGFNPCHPTALSVFIFSPDCQLFFHLSITEETWVMKIFIWCIKIVNVLVLHCTKFDWIWPAGSGGEDF
jgi:hypothetical protein